MRAATMLTVVVIGLALVLAGSASATAPVQIASIQYNPPGDDNGSNSSLNQEFVVIRNPRSHAVTITNWTLRDASHHVYTFGRLRLGAGKFVTVHTGRGDNSRTDVYWDFGAYVWQNHGDTAQLKTNGGSKVDSCRYSGGAQLVEC
jgi:hypothetical protein